MNPIGPLDGATGATTTTQAAKSRDALGKEDFLRLLVTQLSNQDPLNPMDGSQFAAQLAQFSSVEQLINIEQALTGQGEINGMLAQSINSGVAAGLIGKEVEAATNAVTWSGEGTVDLGVETAGDLDGAQLLVKDSTGRTVRTIDLGTLGKGDHPLTWDGTDDAGNTLPGGSYTFSVVTEGGKAAPAQTYLRGQVDRVTFGPEGILLWIGKTSIPMGQVRTVKEG